MTEISPLLPTTDYTSRDYLSLRADMIRLIRARLPQWRGDNPSDFGVALVESMAYSLDILNYYLDRIANEAYLDTAVQRESLYAIAKMFNYTPKPAAPARVELTFLNTSTQTVTLPRRTRCQASVDTGGGALLKNFETDSELIVGPSEERRVLATEGRTYTDEIVGVSNGFSGQQFILPRTSVLPRTVFITTKLNATDGGAPTYTDWTEFDDLADATDKDFSFQVLQETDGSSVVRFGDGLNGRIPAIHSSILATYRVGGGTDGNVAAGSITSIAEPVIYGVSVTNPVPATGGLNPESLESVRRNAANSFRSRDRAVTIEDFASVAESAYWVAKAKGVGNSGSSVALYVSTYDDGTGRPSLSAEDRERTRGYMLDRAMAGVSVTVHSVNWVPVYKKITLVITSTARPSLVEQDAADVLDAYYSFDRVTFDGRVAATDIVTALRDVNGLEYATVTELSTDSNIFAPDYDDTNATADTIWMNRISDGSVHHHRSVEHVRFTVLTTEEAELL